MILYFHGGGFVIGSVAGYRDLLSRLALGADARVLAVDYRLAPEHPFPAQLEDCLAGARALLAGGMDPRRLSIAGDRRAARSRWRRCARSAMRAPPSRPRPH